LLSVSGFGACTTTVAASSTTRGKQQCGWSRAIDQHAVQLPHYCLFGLPAASVLFVQQEPPPVIATVRNVSNSLAMPCFSLGHAS